MKKIFGNNEPDESKTQRAPRVRLLALHNISFKRTTPPSDDIIRIANLSSSGVGFIRAPSSKWPAKGTKIEGVISMKEHSITVSAEIMHVSSSIVGCRFIDSPEDICKTVDNYFDVELAARNLTRVKQEDLLSDVEGVPTWFTGENNCELFFIEDEGQVKSFNLSFFGNYLEGGREMPIKFGFVVEDEDDEKPEKDSNLISWDIAVPGDLFSAAIRFVTNINELTTSQRDQIRSMIEKERSVLITK